MPSFCSNPLPHQMPPTPPYHYDFSASIPVGGRQIPALYPLKTFIQPNSNDYGRSEALEATSQSQCYDPHSAVLSTFSKDMHRPGVPGHTNSNFGSSNGCNNAMNAPLLPPMRISDHTFNDQQDLSSKHAATPTKSDEEKVIGGVAACLDYEMEDMVNFVAETAQGMYEIYDSKLCLADIDISRSVVNSKSLLHPGIHKFVSQMLSSTRLPSSTILLGLHYLATRMTLLSNEQQFHYGNGSVHRMLTTALLLGSKFLDDNTFQNRSWSEVSGIPVEEINQMEASWLTAVEWNMHIDCSDSKGFLLWYHHWQRYQVSKASNTEPLVQPLRPIHLDHRSAQTNRSSYNALLPRNREEPANVERYSKTGFPSSTYWSMVPSEMWPPPSRSHIQYSPPSAPDTGPNTPNWHHSQDEFRLAGVDPQGHLASKVHLPPSGFHTSYCHPLNSYSHGVTCPCGHCKSHYERYLMDSGCGLQTVGA